MRPNRSPRPFIAVLCCPLLLLAIVAGVRAQPAVHRDIEFARVDGHSLKLDLYLPDAAAGPVPVILWIHGGGWSAGDKAPTVAARMAQRGYAVASINYRLSQSAIWPAQLHDCKAAVRWLRGNAERYRLDPSRIGAWGSSAGGHLAAVLGTTGDLRTFTLDDTTIDLEGAVGDHLEESSAVQAVCDWYGPIDFLRMSEEPSLIDHDAPNSPQSRLIGGAVQTLRERARLASPITFAGPSDPPFLIMHGTSDPLVPPAQSRLFDSALEAHTIPSDLHYVGGAGHGGPAFESESTMMIVDAFFDRHLREAVSAIRDGSGSDRLSLVLAPVPMRSAGEVRFDLEERAHVKLAINDAAGNVVALLLDETMDRGSHRVQIDASSLPPGYFRMLLAAGGGRTSHQLIVVR